jgi:hypothetical protein
MTAALTASIKRQGFSRIRKFITRFRRRPGQAKREP